MSIPPGGHSRGGKREGRDCHEIAGNGSKKGWGKGLGLWGDVLAF